MSDGNRFNRFIIRHLDAPKSNKQKFFDVLFGVVVPILCLVFDPIVFSSLLNTIRIAAYIAIGIGSITVAGLVTGILFLGFWSALLLGIAGMPISLVWLLFGIGIFGFTPHLTAFCYLRSARRAMKVARENLSEQMLDIALMAGVMITLVISLGGQWYYDHITTEAMETILSGEEWEVQEAVNDLQKAFWCGENCYDDIVWAYHRTDDEVLKARYQQVYQALTGDDIEDRLRILID